MFIEGKESLCWDCVRADMCLYIMTICITVEPPGSYYAYSTVEVNWIKVNMMRVAALETPVKGFILHKRP